MLNSHSPEFSTVDSELNKIDQEIKELERQRDVMMANRHENFHYQSDHNRFNEEIRELELRKIKLARAVS